MINSKKERISQVVEFPLKDKRKGKENKENIRNDIKFIFKVNYSKNYSAFCCFLHSFSFLFKFYIFVHHQI